MIESHSPHYDPFKDPKTIDTERVQELLAYMNTKRSPSPFQKNALVTKISFDIIPRILSAMSVHI